MTAVFAFKKASESLSTPGCFLSGPFPTAPFFEISVFFYQRKAKYIYRSFFDFKRQYRFALTARYLCFIRFPSVSRHENFSGCAFSARYRDFAFTSCRYFDFFCIGKVKVFIASYCAFFRFTRHLSLPSNAIIGKPLNRLLPPCGILPFVQCFLSLSCHSRCL